MRFASTLLLLSLATAGVAQPSEDRGPGLIADGSGDARSYRAGGFDRVALATPSHMDVRVGPAASVRATGPQAAFARLRVAVERGGLVVEPRYRDAPESDRALMRQVRFTVTLPRLTAVALAGSGGIAVDRIDGGDFHAELGGSGDLALGRLAVERARVTIGGSGSVTAAGHARSLNVTLGGSGRFDAPDLHAGEARVMSAGSGSVRAAVDGAATVQVAGSGSVDLGASAQCTTSRSGSGTVRCGG